MITLQRDTAIGANDETLRVGMKVICVNAIVQGDCDTYERWDIKQGDTREIEAIVDDENLIVPMVTLKGSQNGPFMAHRFVSENERVALDSGYNILKKGDVVVCLDDDEHGDTGSEFDLVKGKRYVVDEIYDDDNLYAPMILIENSGSGPVFPNRFKRIIRA